MAAPSFHRLRVVERRAETADAIALGFAVPAPLREAYRYRQGQFVTLRASIDGEELRRSYSVCESVGAYRDGAPLRIAIKRVAGGRFSNWANDHLREGSEIEVAPPDGRFQVPLDPSSRRRYAAFAGGSGITPVLSLIATTLETEPLAEFTLVYGNRGSASIMFVEALEALKNRHLRRLRLIHVLADEDHEIELFNGVLDEARCARLLTTLVPAAQIDVAFVCGPQPMMDAVERALLAAGVPSPRILIERFGLPGALPAPVAPVRPQADAGASADVVLEVDGKSRRLRVPFDGPSLLDAGIAAGANLPWACKAGVCSTCRARVLEGEVRMLRNHALDDDEVARGFVLSCQAHPVSDRVVISFDER